MICPSKGRMLYKQKHGNNNVPNDHLVSEDNNDRCPATMMGITIHAFHNRPYNRTRDDTKQHLKIDQPTYFALKSPDCKNLINLSITDNTTLNIKCTKKRNQKLEPSLAPVFLSYPPPPALYNRFPQAVAGSGTDRWL